MRWLLCGDDGSKTDQNEICNYKKKSREGIFPLQFYINSKKLKSALNYSHYNSILIQKTNLHHVKSVIIFAGMVLCRNFTFIDFVVHSEVT